MNSKRATHSPTRCWCRISITGTHREGAVGVLPRPTDRLPCLSAGRGRRRRRRGDQAEREPAGWCALVSRGSARSSTGTARCRSTIIMPLDSATPLLIDCNPRLVEPMNAYRAGTDLVDLLLRVSLGETPRRIAGKPRGRADASRDAGAARMRITRRHAARYHRRMLASAARQRTLRRQQRGTDAGAAGLGSAVPLAMTAMLLLASPKLANQLARGGFGAHLLDLGSIRMIESEGFSIRGVGGAHRWPTSPAS